MFKKEVICPSCEVKIPVEVDMYIDSGDVCYDLFVDEEFAEESESLHDHFYTCTSCEKHFKIILDNDYWGSEDIPLTAKLYQRR